MNRIKQLKKLGKTFAAAAAIITFVVEIHELWSDDDKQEQAPVKSDG